MDGEKNPENLRDRIDTYSGPITFVDNKNRK